MGRQGRVSCQPGKVAYRACIGRVRVTGLGGRTWPGRHTLPAGMQNPDPAAGGQSYAALLVRLRQQQGQRSRHIVGTWQPLLNQQASANRLRRRPAAVGALYLPSDGSPADPKTRLQVLEAMVP